MKEGKVVNNLNKDKVKWECTSTYLQFNVDCTKVLMKTLCSEKRMASYHNFFMERPFRLFLTCCLFSWTFCFLSAFDHYSENCVFAIIPKIIWMRVPWCQPFSCKIGKRNSNLHFRFSFTDVIGKRNSRFHFRFPFTYYIENGIRAVCFRFLFSHNFG